ncbi:hypothetical protein G6F62_010717 [Rhizopus arrhizus]|nr:hypothetical protein G6F62_010717 [Rhizopus arrhizus]
MLFIKFEQAVEYTIPKNKQNVVTENLNDDSFSDSCSSQEENQTLSKRDALDYLKQILLNATPINDKEYDRVFVSTFEQHELLAKHFGKTNVTANQFERWINADGYWGSTRRLQRGEHPHRQRGRYVWKLKDEHCDLIDRESYKRLKNHLRTNPMITIGYVRKSLTKEGHVSRLGLLQKMINRLKRGTYCSKVYVSPKSTAATPLKQRDQVENEIDLTQLDCCDGDTRTFIDKLKCDFREIRIACYVLVK